MTSPTFSLLSSHLSHIFRLTVDIQLLEFPYDLVSYKAPHHLIKRIHPYVGERSKGCQFTRSRGLIPVIGKALRVCSDHCRCESESHSLYFP